MWKIIPQDSTTISKYSPFRGLVLTFARAKPFHYFEDYMWSVLLHFFAKSFRRRIRINVEEHGREEHGREEHGREEHGREEHGREEHGLEELDLEKLDLAQQNDQGWIASPLKLPFQELHGHVCVVHHDSLLVIGGRSGEEVYAAIHEIQLKEAPPYTSRGRSNTIRPICYHGAVKLASKVYIFGGIETSATRGIFPGAPRAIFLGATRTVQVFDPENNTCTELRRLPKALSHMACAAWREYVFVLGGKDGEGNVLDTVTMYDVNNQHDPKQCKNMKEKRCGCTAVTMRDIIVVMGGEDKNGDPLNTAEHFIILEDIWRDFPAMTEARAFATAVRCNISLP